MGGGRTGGRWYHKGGCQQWAGNLQLAGGYAVSVLLVMAELKV